MSKLQITPGAIEADMDALFDPQGTMVASTYDKWAGANATLYADAHNTYQKDPTLPSELNRQRDEAVKLLILMSDTIAAHDIHADSCDRREGCCDCIERNLGLVRTFLDTLTK